MVAAKSVTETHKIGIRIIFKDETTFTSQNILDKAWAHKDAAIAVTDKYLKSFRLNLLIAVSEDRGIYDWLTTTDNLSSGFTIRLLESIAESKCGPVFFFNASFYWSKKVGGTRRRAGNSFCF